MEAVDAMGARDVRMWPNWYQQTNAADRDAADLGVPDMGGSDCGASSKRGSRGNDGTAPMQANAQDRDAAYIKRCENGASGNCDSRGSDGTILMQANAQGRDSVDIGTSEHKASEHNSSDGINSCLQTFSNAPDGDAADVGSCVCAASTAPSKRRRVSEDSETTAATASHPGVDAFRTTAAPFSHPGGAALQPSAVLAHPGVDLRQAGTAAPHPGVELPPPSAVSPCLASLNDACLGTDVGTHPGVDDFGLSEAACEKPYLCTGYDCYVVRVSLINYTSRLTCRGIMSFGNPDGSRVYTAGRDIT